MRTSASLIIFAVALAVRLAFVLWAPGEPTGDGLFYHQHGIDIAAGNGYVNIDRSPANTWMPGWPATLGAVYAVFGAHAKIAMALNALLAALTAIGVVRLGARLFGPRAGVIAGSLYALWPGLIYYSATLFSEALFSLLLVVALNLVVDATRAQQRRLRGFALAGLALGACTLVKSEPLVLCIPVAVFFHAARESRRDFVLGSLVCFGVTLACLAPWTLRNYVVFDRFIPTAAGGGMAVAAANHPGATGGNDLGYLIDYLARLGVTNASLAEQTLAMNDQAWGDVRDFVRDHPGEAARLSLRKLALTYSGDASGADLVRGFFGPDHWRLDDTSWRRLVVVADTWWWSVLIAFAVGVTRLRVAPPPTRALLVGLMLTWVALHVVFIGGPRYHVPELVVVAVVAGRGLDWICGDEDAPTATG